MSDALAAFGTLLKIGDGTTPTEVFATVAEVKEIGGPSLELETVDVTSHSSAGGWREFVGTLLNGGEVELTLNFVPDNPTQDASTGLIADMVARTKRNFQLVFPDVAATTWDFTALVTGFEITSAVDGALEAECTLQITGAPTLT